LYEQANQAYRSGEFDEARDCFQKCIDMDPRYARAHAGLGNVALIRGDFETAEACYHRAVELEPELEKILLPLRVTIQMKTFQRALQKADINLRKVYGLLSKGQLDKLEQALTRNVPFDLLIGETLSLTLEERGRLQEMVVERTRSLKDPLRCRLFYGYYLLPTEQYAQLALTAFESAVDKIPEQEQQDVYMRMGRLYEHTGSKNRAVDAYRNAVRAGRPMTEVAPLLSGIYGIPANRVTDLFSGWLDGD
jgi:tetratricopeptide (TPR) repeat protein